MYIKPTHTCGGRIRGRGREGEVTDNLDHLIHTAGGARPLPKQSHPWKLLAASRSGSTARNASEALLSDLTSALGGVVERWRSAKKVMAAALSKAARAFRPRGLLRRRIFC